LVLLVGEAQANSRFCRRGSVRDGSAHPDVAVPNASLTCGTDEEVNPA
jgi:hypothetical protein